MWSVFTLNRPLVWTGIAAMASMSLLPTLMLRMAALVVVLVGGWDAWRQIRLEATRRRLTETALTLSPDGVLISNAQNRIQAVNPAFTQITGYSVDEIRGLDPSVLSSGRHDKAFYERYWQTLNATGQWEGEVWNQRKHGDEFPEWLRVHAVTDAKGRVTHYVGLFTDISRHKAREQDLQRIGFEDPLTGLPNRRRLHDLLASRLQRLRAGEELDIALIDIDGFKAVNDAMGVDKGDRLLSRFGQRLAAFVAGGVVGRLGGDEFMAIRTTTFDDHEQWVEELRGHLSEPFEIGETPLRLGLTIGSCRSPDDGRDAGVLFQRLESALYAAKRHGRNHSRRFRPSLEVEGDPQLELLNELRQALAHGTQLELFYQTQHYLDDGRLAGMEALLRWYHPTQGMISPASFIPLAERHGLMSALGDWVIERACAQVAAWRQQGVSFVPVWINISAVQLIQGDLEAKLSASLAKYHVPAAMLGLELTESVLLDERAGDISARLVALRDKGHPIAIDDFGTGYSSMAYLKQLPVDKLKLDRAFVRALPEDSADAAITSAVLAMARGLELDVVAEGVETEEQRDFLLAQGCAMVQGFLYARPERVADVEARLRRDAEVSLP
ncbi:MULTISPECIES: GGDEF domain-containing phosphodiesterase [Chromohalobacter]|uniref:Diguanylate cyclase/phosphodiesterase with PAS/PAC sensor(S) n=1 Tax=Chromohalobacter israelensis (strain ATCC BAA-138 / DSM 3043 / CIP 106854 / NCIMB 13768 / 1H11) TaxID=290398 RepID=Q1R0D8_CHRI1|nr:MULTISPECIES: GGDEF domain-containing phosphodiesterase [Chromohalobacter]ABE57820.1 diguanylate cyclase/phosphodiesterase with PAS/PAC sensor(s) [Chromohalobacter salexigens DSM 3043]MDO0947334.1 EAL domain-containing protein [Chromohalobacter salexigens]NQY47392.1 EAL domain-containing protein [Chromohalobacter sp.]NWO57843.1 phosphodiesterase [Chromohalobacter salexigens]